jgi:uncharacterized membrane protein
MKSKAAFKDHPLHPALVTVPIGAWFAAFVGDFVYAATAAPFWYEFSYYTMLIGWVGALLAACFGLMDYFGVKMSEAGYRLARIHMWMNLTITAVYTLNLWLRMDSKATTGSAWTTAMALQILSFAALGISGWIGGTMSYKHKVGIVENADPEATSIGAAEPTYAPEAQPTRTRGLQG